MAYDIQGFGPGTQVRLSDRARFAADLAKHANEPYGVQGKSNACAPGRFYGGTSWVAIRNWQEWFSPFIARYDALPRQPTGFDCLCILSQIP